MFENTKTKERVREWVMSLEEPPSRKALRKKFPAVPVKLLRAVLQSVADERLALEDVP